MTISMQVFLIWQMFTFNLFGCKLNLKKWRISMLKATMEILADRHTALHSADVQMLITLWGSRRGQIWPVLITETKNNRRLFEDQRELQWNLIHTVPERNNGSDNNTGMLSFDMRPHGRIVAWLYGGTFILVSLNFHHPNPTSDHQVN